LRPPGLPDNFLLGRNTTGAFIRLAWKRHAEHWALFRDVKPNALTDEELDRVLAPLLLKTVGTEQ